MRIRNVLIFPAGTEIGLEIRQALHSCKEVRLFAAGQEGSNHARFLYPEYHVVPSVHSNDWLDALVRVCLEKQIDYVFPAHDDVIVALSREAPRIPARVVTSSQRACETTRSKADTYRALSGKVRVPIVYSRAEEVDIFPVIVKPNRGQGSFAVTKVDDAEQLSLALRTVPDPVICEFLPGEEYTVDCFSDRDTGILFAGARSRGRTRNGISVSSVTVELSEAREWADVIGRELGLCGAWFFQVKRDVHNQLKLLEVAPRIAGSMATHRVTGVNFPLLSIYEAERVPVVARPNPGPVTIDRALGNRYRHRVQFSRLYMDLDDTLLLNGCVNLEALHLLFKCINEGKQTILVTRHAGDLDQTLARHHLSGVFHQIIHLREREKKSAYIAKEDAIYVDDSFAERNDVAQVCGIPTFDCSMIELLNNGTGEF